MELAAAIHTQLNKSQFMPLWWKPTTVGCLKWLLSHLCCISVFHCFIWPRCWEMTERSWSSSRNCSCGGNEDFVEFWLWGGWMRHQTPQFAAEWDPRCCVRALCSPSLSWYYHPVVSEWIRISRKMGFPRCWRPGKGVNIRWMSWKSHWWVRSCCPDVQLEDKRSSCKLSRLHKTLPGFPKPAFPGGLKVRGRPVERKFPG